MKNLENRKATVTLPDGTAKETSYADFCLSAVNGIPQGGLNAEEMAKRLRLIEALKAGGETLPLEDSDAETLKALVKDMRWVVISPDVVAFCEAVKSL